MFNLVTIKTEDGFAAAAPYRDITCEGKTDQEAIGRLIDYYMRLARSGAIDPRDLTAPGCGPIGHVMSVLAEHLARCVENRKYLANTNPDGTQREGDEHDFGVPSQIVLLRNRQIAGIATAIASLARVESL